MAPPSSLLEHAPVALLLNAILDTLNDLRQCAPVRIAPRVSETMTAALGAVVDALVDYRSHTHVEGEFLRLYEAMAKATGQVFLPYVVRCVDAVFASPTPLVDQYPLKVSDGLVEGGRMGARACVRACVSSGSNIVSFTCI